MNMTEAEKRMKRCCFTGHRPGKLKQDEQTVKRLLAASINQAVTRGYTTFITGMAQGTDIWAAEIVLDMRRDTVFTQFSCTIAYKKSRI